MRVTVLFPLSQSILAEVTAGASGWSYNFMVQCLPLEMELVNRKYQRHHKEKCSLGNTCQFLSNQLFPNLHTDFYE